MDEEEASRLGLTLASTILTREGGRNYILNCLTKKEHSTKLCKRKNYQI